MATLKHHNYCSRSYRDHPGTSRPKIQNMYFKIIITATIINAHMVFVFLKTVLYTLQILLSVPSGPPREVAKLFCMYRQQGSHRSGKTGKFLKTFSSQGNQGKIREFDGIKKWEP